MSQAAVGTDLWTDSRLDRRDVADGFEEAPVVEPVDQFERSVLHRFEIAARAGSVNYLGLRALCAESHEIWLEDSRYLNMDLLREHRKGQLKKAA